MLQQSFKATSLRRSCDRNVAQRQRTAVWSVAWEKLPEGEEWKGSEGQSQNETNKQKAKTKPSKRNPSVD